MTNELHRFEFWLRINKPSYVIKKIMNLVLSLLILRWQLKLFWEGQKSNEFSREYKFERNSYIFNFHSVVNAISSHFKHYMFMMYQFCTLLYLLFRVIGKLCERYFLFMVMGGPTW